MYSFSKSGVRYKIIFINDYFGKVPVFMLKHKGKVFNNSSSEKLKLK